MVEKHVPVIEIRIIEGTPQHAVQLRGLLEQVIGDFCPANGVVVTTLLESTLDSQTMKTFQ